MRRMMKIQQYLGADHQFLLGTNLILIKWHTCIFPSSTNYILLSYEVKRLNKIQIQIQITSRLHSWEQADTVSTVFSFSKVLSTGIVSSLAHSGKKRNCHVTQSYLWLLMLLRCWLLLSNFYRTQVNLGSDLWVRMSVCPSVTDLVET